MAVCALLLAGCGNNYPDRDFKDDMRRLISDLGSYAKTEQAGFLVVPQNGLELLTLDGDPSGEVSALYTASVDGVGREDLFYGYNRDDKATPKRETEYFQEFLDLLRVADIPVLVTDYCSTPENVDDAIAQNLAADYVPFPAPDRELRLIPAYPAIPVNVNSDNITSLAEVRNFCYLINPDLYGSAEVLIAALQATDFDLLILDLFVDGTALTSDQVNSLKTKNNGGSRLVIAYCSVGEAENYRYYWDPAWEDNPPLWLDKENPDWEGNFKVWYWEAEWQALLFGNPDAYVDRILAAGFDGAYLDLVEAYEYFE